MIDEKREAKAEVEEGGEERTDVEELREAMNAVLSLVDKLKDAVKDVLATITTSLDGKRLGQEVVALYSELKRSGLPDEVVNRMVEEFYKKKLEQAPTVNDLIKAVIDVVRGGRPRVVVKEEKMEEKS